MLPSGNATSGYLRFTGFGSTVRYLSSLFPKGTDTTRELVCLGSAVLVTSEGKDDLAVLERLHVRILDAAAGYADLSEYTLIDQTLKTVVQRQIDYGKQRGIVWGISESGFNTVDIQLNYQYRAFGVPGLRIETGACRRLGHCALCHRARLDGRTGSRHALTYNALPRKACSDNSAFYEAVDYTPSRQRRGETEIQ